LFAARQGTLRSAENHPARHHLHTVRAQASGDLHGFTALLFSTNPTSRNFPVFQTTAEELGGSFLSKTALGSVRGTPLADVIHQVFAKLTRGMQGQSQLAWSDLDEAVSSKSRSGRPRDMKLFGSLADSF
jgi:hypothetical protein